MSAARIDHGQDALRNLEGALELMQENGADGVTLASQQIAIAGVQATLALVEQRRIASIVSLTEQGLVNPDDQRRAEILKALGLA